MKNRVGEKWVTSEGYTIKIIEYIGAKNCTIQFENGVIIKNIQYAQIEKGHIKNPYHKSVYGVGYFGQGKYSQKIYPKIYSTWIGMLRRCYDLKHQEKYPTYKGCLVDESWHDLQVFALWFEKYYKENFALDKDILSKCNKIYSPKTCTFVPQEVNNSLIKHDTKRGKCPIGVCKAGNKFVAQIRINGKSVFLGHFNTPEEAFQMYKIEKEKYIKDVAEKWKNQITEPTYRALINYKVEMND